MFCSGVPAASCRTTDERDGQQSQWPDKSHFCELTLNQGVFWRFAVVIFAWLTHFCVVVKTMTQTIKEQTRPLEDLYEKLNYSACKGTVCNKTWRNHFEVRRFLDIFVDFFFFFPQERSKNVRSIPTHSQEPHRYTMHSVYWHSENIIYTHRYCNLKNQQTEQKMEPLNQHLVVVRGFRTSPRTQLLLHDLKWENLQIHFEWWNKWSLIMLKA